MSTRTLVSIRRRPAPTDSTSYEEAWGALRAAAQAQKAHAWRFRSAGDDRLFIEFLEFRAASDPRGEAAVAESLVRLDAIAPGIVEEWTDAEEPGQQDMP